LESAEDREDEVQVLVPLALEQGKSAAAISRLLNQDCQASMKGDVKIAYTDPGTFSANRSSLQSFALIL